MDDLNLTEGDIRSSLWIKLSGYWLVRINELRKMNEMDKTEAETAKIRGRIAEIRLMLAYEELPK